MPVVNQHLVFDVARPDANYLDEGFERAPGFATNFSRAIRQVVRIIHSIPYSGGGFPLDEAEVYLGRSTKTGVLARMNARHKLRGHTAGTIALRAQTAYLEDLETVGIAILKELQRSRLLCVANVRWDSSGGQTRSNDGCIYLTWGRVPRVVLSQPSKRSLRDVARAVKARTRGKVDVSQVMAGLESVIGTHYNYLEDTGDTF